MIAFSKHEASKWKRMVKVTEIKNSSAFCSSVKHSHSDCSGKQTSGCLPMGKISSWVLYPSYHLQRSIRDILGPLLILSLIWVLFILTFQIRKWRFGKMRLPGLQITCWQKVKLEFDAIQARNRQRHPNYHSISPATLSRATWQVLAFVP